MCFPRTPYSKIALATLTQTRGTISERPHSYSKGASLVLTTCLRKIFTEWPDRTKTTPRYQSINIMKPFPFKQLACVCLPPFPWPRLLPPQHSLNFSSSLNKLGWMQGGGSLQTWPRPKEPKRFPWGPPVRSLLSPAAECRMGRTAFTNIMSNNPTSQDMKRSLFGQPLTQVAGILDKDIISSDISSRHLLEAWTRQPKVIRVDLSF